MTVDQTRVNQIAAVQQAQTILLIATWKRLVFSALAYLAVPALAFRGTFEVSGGRGEIALAAWIATMPVIHLVSRLVPEASLEEVARQFEVQQRTSAGRTSLAERLYADQEIAPTVPGDSNRDQAA